MNEQIGNYRIVDLTKKLIPREEKRRLKLRRFLVEESQDYHTDMDMTSHLGTHVESPFHYKNGWKDISELPVSAFVGRGVMLDFKDIEPGVMITTTSLEKANHGRIREGDAVLLKSPFHCEPFSNRSDDQRPQLSAESAEWFAIKKVKAIGFGDSIAIENNIEEGKEFHEILMSRDITFIEVMENFHELSRDIFMLIFLPLPIVGLDACPIRAIAIEGIPDFK